ncbi:DUF465 domain-containing protein [Aestuariibacter halophilus]|uniref:DUF465 domain-containing protein n=1 Tax=Fluctibacter halophilus TaxID=226011 RepID=A0ABS8GDS3_9ALTE|nr:DUF465 domain-containing protein [Aestuariibacter halophilus]MCC2618261.1 DUF465 domain-containing protein [Aestuariibacter halophilus]
MPLEKHSFLKEFPDHHHTIRHLKMNDAHFAKLFDEYNALDHDIYNVESSGSVVADEELERKKLRRVELKDALLSQVKKEEALQ